MVSFDPIILPRFDCWQRVQPTVPRREASLTVIRLKAFLRVRCSLGCDSAPLEGETSQRDMSGELKIVASLMNILTAKGR
jgi:hypothetical protein